MDLEAFLFLRQSLRFFLPSPWDEDDEDGEGPIMRPGIFPDGDSPTLSEYFT